jgi:hypothetical protein
MKTERILIAVLVLALLLTAAFQLGQAQNPGAAALAQEPDPAAQQEDPDAGSQPAPPVQQPAEEAGVAAVLNDQIPIQGRLTDASGNPLNGTYPMVLGVYSAPTGGTLLCGNWVEPNVVVDHGLFDVTIDLCDFGNVFEGDQLYLGVKVGEDAEMTPRLPIYGVPYAFTVRPGAVIKGGTTYLWVPGTAFIKDQSDDTTRWDLLDATARIYRGGTLIGTKHIRIPITIPSELYGQSVRVTQVAVYYKCQDGAQAYITETELYKQTDADSSVSLVDDSTNRQSNTATSYTLATDSATNTLSAGQGSMALRLGIFFNDDTNYVQIGGVRLTLVTNY